jgi:glycosyltransferase involved in cell wall biosynthesis
MRPNKVIYFPNWTESEMAYEGSEVKQCPFQFKGCFNIVYTGNIGEAQDFSNVLEAFSYLKNPLIHLYLVGNGRAYDLVKSKIEELNLQEVVYLLGQVKPEIVPSVIAEADAVLLSLKSAEIFSVTVPAKLQVYLTAGKPILGMVSGEAKAIIDESNAGYCVEAGDYIGLSMIIKRMSELSTQDITIMGKNGADYSQSVFERKTLLDIAVKLIHEK